MDTLACGLEQLGIKPVHLCPALYEDRSTSTFSPVKRNTPPLTMFTVLSLLLLTGADSATACAVGRRQRPNSWWWEFFTTRFVWFAV
ncbi:unnamed protein product [Pleuronectes platessa]|uniref:Uncharacterized protein n=1 Tax=Pleuronectes platessa TaxID=8262 RepID=A0A9N7YIH3_PLEPL|nr:unnamed protein product [Pleuronectes platessa]